MQILYLPEVWHSGSDGSGAVITDFSGAGISAKLALQKRRIHSSYEYTNEMSAYDLLVIDDFD